MVSRMADIAFEGGNDIHARVLGLVRVRAGCIEVANACPDEIISYEGAFSIYVENGSEGVAT